MELIEQNRGPAHPGLLRGVTELAILRLRQKKYIEAEQSARRALAIAEAALPGNAFPRFLTAAVLGKALAGQGRLDEADVYYKRALAVCEQASGPRSATYASLLDDYARFLRLAKKPKEARAVRARATAILSLTNSTVDVSDLRRK